MNTILFLNELYFFNRTRASTNSGNRARTITGNRAGEEREFSLTPLCVRFVDWATLANEKNSLQHPRHIGFLCMSLMSFG